MTEGGLYSVNTKREIQGREPASPSGKVLGFA